MRFAYADPPYLGKAAKLYGSLHPDAADFDDPETHRRLVESLCAEFPDGWAISLGSPSLRILLPMCPADVRVMAWVKPFASFKPGVNPAYTWEPVIVRGGRKRDRSAATVRDHHIESITLGRGLVGVKPDGFVRWILAVLGVLPSDQFVDLFPGSGAVTRAWERWRAQMPLGFGA